MGIDGQIAVEVRTRFETLSYWRFLVPETAPVLVWGHGPSGGGAIAPVKMAVVEGTVVYDGEPCRFFGSGDQISPSVSAYVVFDGTLPEYAAFGTATEPFGPPQEVEIVNLSKRT